MEDQPSLLELFLLLRDLVRVRQGPDSAKHYQEYRKLNTFKYNRALSVEENVVALKLACSNLDTLSVSYDEKG